MMANWHDSERLRGFADRQTDFCNYRVAFATENLGRYTQERGKSDLTWINVFFKFGNVIIQAHYVNVLDCKNQPLTGLLFN